MPLFLVVLYVDLFAGNEAAEGDDDDFDPKSRKSKGKARAKAAPVAENIRAALHTLDEHHDYLLSGSYDVSLNAGADVPSSSQFDAGFGYDFDNDLFNAAGGVDVGADFGDELARELGEGWGAEPLPDSNM